jgi:hypothetical protein
VRTFYRIKLNFDQTIQALLLVTRYMVRPPILTYIKIALLNHFILSPEFLLFLLFLFRNIENSVFFMNWQLYFLYHLTHFHFLSHFLFNLVYHVLLKILLDLIYLNYNKSIKLVKDIAYFLQLSFLSSSQN